MRRRLIQFFNFHAAIIPEDLADEAFNRLAKKIRNGETIQKIPQYLAGIARMLLLEERHRTRRETQFIESALHVFHPDQENNQMLDALEACLEQISSSNRKLLDRYYTAESRNRILNRQKMAEELGISLNSLRNRALRLREKLEHCVRARVG